MKRKRIRSTVDNTAWEAGTMLFFTLVAFSLFLGYPSLLNTDQPQQVFAEPTPIDYYNFNPTLVSAFLITPDIYPQIDPFYQWLELKQQNLIDQVLPPAYGALPSAPTGFTVVQDHQDRANLSWDAVTDADDYEIFRNGTSLGNATTGKTIFIDKTITTGSVFAYKVRAINSTGFGANSTEINFGLIDQITGLVVGIVTDTTVELDWSSATTSDVDALTGIEVQRKHADYISENFEDRFTGENVTDNFDFEYDLGALTGGRGILDCPDFPMRTGQVTGEDECVNNFVTDDSSTVINGSNSYLFDVIGRRTTVATTNLNSNIFKLNISTAIDAFSYRVFHNDAFGGSTDIAPEGGANGLGIQYNFVNGSEFTVGFTHLQRGECNDFGGSTDYYVRGEEFCNDDIGDPQSFYILGDGLIDNREMDVFNATELQGFRTLETVSLNITEVFASNVSPSPSEYANVESWDFHLGGYAHTGSSGNVFPNTASHLGANFTLDDLVFKNNDGSNVPFSDWTTVTTLAPSAITYTDTVTAGTDFLFRVIPISTNSSGRVSEAVNATTPIFPPSTPTGFTVIQDMEDEAELDWDDDTEADNFEVFRNDTLIGSPTVSEFTDTTLTPLTDVFAYKIRGSNAGGFSGNTTEIDFGLIQHIENMNATALSQDSILVEWDLASTVHPTDPLTGVRIERALSTDNAIFYDSQSFDQGTGAWSACIWTLGAGVPCMMTSSFLMTEPFSVEQMTVKMGEGGTGFGVGTMHAFVLPPEEAFQLADGLSTSAIDFTKAFNSTSKSTSLIGGGLQGNYQKFTFTSSPTFPANSTDRYAFGIFIDSHDKDVSFGSTRDPPALPKDLPETFALFGNTNCSATGTIFKAFFCGTGGLDYLGNLTLSGISVNASGNSVLTGSDFTLLTVVDDLDVNHTDTGLLQDTTYFYRAKGVSAVSTGAFDEVVNATTQEVDNTPSKITGVVGTPTGSGNVLTWDEPTNQPTGYKIERAIGAGAFSVLVADTASTSRTFTDSAVTASTLYKYKISGINGEGTGEASDPIPVTTIDVPTTVSDLDATAVDDNIDLLWSAVTDEATGYQIERKEGDGGFITLIADTGTNATAFTDTTVTAGIKYTYKVIGLNIFGSSLESNTATATALNPPNMPTLTAVQDVSEIDLSWNEPQSANPIQGYKIDRRINSGAFSVLIANTSSTATTFTDASGLTAGDTFGYRVRALSVSGEGTVSNVVDVVFGSHVLVQVREQDGSGFKGLGEVLLENSTFSQVVALSSTSNAQFDNLDTGTYNFTFTDNDDFILNKTINFAFPAPNVTSTLTIFALVFDTDCPSNGGGTDVRIKANYTNIQDILEYPSIPICDSEDKVSFSVTWTGDAGSDTSKIVADFISPKFMTNADSFLVSAIPTTTSYSSQLNRIISDPFTVTTTSDVTINFDLFLGEAPPSGGSSPPSLGTPIGGGSSATSIPAQKVIFQLRLTGLTLLSLTHGFVQPNDIIDGSVTVGWDGERIMSVKRIEIGEDFTNILRFDERTPFDIDSVVDGTGETARSEGQIGYNLFIPPAFCDADIGITQNCLEREIITIPVTFVFEFEGVEYVGGTEIVLDAREPTFDIVQAQVIVFALVGIFAVLFASQLRRRFGKSGRTNRQKKRTRQKIGSRKK